MKENSLAVFEDYKIRRVYDEESETWYFSVVDIIQVLIQQPDYQAARNYWKVLKNRLNKDGSESVTKCNRLKMVAADGMQHFADVEQMEDSVIRKFRITADDVKSYNTKPSTFR
jgi:hypothetical protein